MQSYLNLCKPNSPGLDEIACLGILWTRFACKSAWLSVQRGRLGLLWMSHLKQQSCPVLREGRGLGFRWQRTWAGPLPAGAPTRHIRYLDLLQQLWLHTGPARPPPWFLSHTPSQGALPQTLPWAWPPLRRRSPKVSLYVTGRLPVLRN